MDLHGTITTAKIDNETQAFDYLVWQALFPEEKPQAVRASVLMMAQPDEDTGNVRAEHLAEAVWAELFDDADRAVFCELMSDIMGAWTEEVDDNVVVRSLARTFYWHAGAGSIFPYQVAPAQVLHPIR